MSLLLIGENSRVSRDALVFLLGEASSTSSASNDALNFGGLPFFVYTCLGITVKVQSSVHLVLFNAR